MVCLMFTEKWMFKEKRTLHKSRKAQVSIFFSINNKNKVYPKSISEKCILDQ